MSRTDAPAIRAETAAALLAAGRTATPPDLPIAAARDALRDAIGAHQVVIVAGATGSGKSTQLPKLCLELGRGVAGLIGHTQPRRVAARTIAERVASELGTVVGDAVASTVRFDDRTGPSTLVRVMTDGILLAEIGRDRLLRRYDTLIVDEAHERSLNIDFILGYLAQLRPRRPDLKVIVTSATIDTERFATHFAVDGRPAPIVEVEGRMYPVEVRYRPYGLEPDDDRDQVQAIADAVDELERLGDVLVFLSGEREIHDTADALRRSARPGTEVLPLYARLPAAEQRRVFAPHAGRRIVLSTNVAETSITVPGIRTVVDTGVARISRFSRRSKVQQLPIEPIARASADQRAGRCGRVAPGVCIRLYPEEDFAARPEFTEPEILRTNLASVILQMTAIGLGDVAAFPFVEPPDRAAVRDGYLLLEELGAIERPDAGGAVRRLTAVGRRLARLPVDPRLGRMVLAAGELDCVREVLVIAAALSIQDVRERPAPARREQRAEADERHRRFDVPGSDLLSIVALWEHLRTEQRAGSSSRFRRVCRAEYLNYLRVREWQDLVRQLRHAAAQVGIDVGTAPAHPEDVHRALLTGLLSHIGTRDREGREYLGARGTRFVISSDSAMAKRAGQWVMAGELVETNRIWARRVATIEPAWVERAAAHLVKQSYGEPRWEARSGRAVTSETVTLYGLSVVSGRTVGYDRVDHDTARWMFIRHALVEGDWSSHHEFLVRNRAFVAMVQAMEARVRRGGLVDDDALHAFYGARIGPGVVSGRHFDRWWRDAGTTDPQWLDLDETVLDAGSGLVHLADYPDVWTNGALHLPLTYRFEPGHPLDGVTVHLTLTSLNQVVDEGFDWQIPGYRRELAEALVRSLPKDVRRRLIPMGETIEAVTARLGPPHGRIVDALAAAISDVSGVPVSATDLDPTQVPAHLRVNFVVTDDVGTVHDAGWDLAAIRSRTASAARAAIAAATPIEERRGIVTWDVGALPQVVESWNGHHTVRAFPALLDDDDSVSLRILTNEDLQGRVMRGGVRRLLLLTAAPSAAAVTRDVDPRRRLAAASVGTDVDRLAADAVIAAVDDVVSRHDLPWDEPAFARLQRESRATAAASAARTLATALDVLAATARVRGRLAVLVAGAAQRSVADATAHLDRLTRAGFVVTAGAASIADVLRYVTGVEHRVERLAEDLARDVRRMAEVVPLERRYATHLATLGRGAVSPAIAELGWQLEELRVSVFAQPVGARGSPSPTKLRRVLDALGA